MFTLPALPFAEDALSPHMSDRTLQFHHGKHHKDYVDKLNDLVGGTELEGLSLEEVISRTHDVGDPDARQIFNNAAQHWNHSFFWRSLTPDASPPQGELAALITSTFGGLESFANSFKEKGIDHFGSGWVWLVARGASLEIVTTHDADTPLANGQTALLCCDLWEHAYYLDYQNRRADFLTAFTSHLANWRFAEENLRLTRAAASQGAS